MAKGAFIKSIIKKAEDAGLLDMSEAARMERARELGFDTENVFTHTGGEITQIDKGGLFDGVFAVSGDEGYGLGGDVETKFIFKNPVASSGDSDFDYDKAIQTLKKQYPNQSDEFYDDLYSWTAEDKADPWSNNILEDLGFDDPGEASWEAQRLRGRIAHDQGFDAVAMNDETGTSYLIPSGSSARSIKAAFDPAKKESGNILASVIPAGIGLGALSFSSQDASAEDKAKNLLKEPISPLQMLAYAKPNQGAIEAPKNETYMTMADLAGKYNNWRKSNIHPIADMMLPVGELPEDQLRARAYGDKVGYWESVLAGLGLM